MIKRPEKLIFLQELFNKRGLPFFYRGGTNLLSHQALQANMGEEKVHPSNSKYLVRDVPSYFDVQVRSKRYQLKKVEVPFYKGYVIYLAHFDSFQEYLTKKLKSARYSEIKRLERHLINCFSITYSFYHGAIDLEVYKSLFIRLKSLTIKRFQQKKEQNYELQHFDAFEKEIYPLLLKKEASIFVIYDGNKPISIRVDIHYQKFVYGLLRSFDTDYSKFGLGEIDMLKNVQWAFENEYYAIDLLKGYYSYKKKWSTTDYSYVHHIVYPKNGSSVSVTSLLLAYYIELRHVLIKLGKQIGLDKALKNVKKLLFERNKSQPEITMIEMEAISEHMKEIDLENDDYQFFRKTYYDHLYKHSLKKDHFKTYIDQNNPHRFYVRSCTETA